jgi:hypothetical protein
MQQNVSVQLDTPAPTGGLKVIFSTSTGEAQVLSSCPDGTPSCVLVPAGQFSTSFAVGGETVTAAGKPVTVTANATSNNVTWQSASMQVTVVTPVMQLFDPSNGVILTSRTVGSAVENIGARFCVSTSNCPAVLSAAQTVNFSISNDTSGGETVIPASVVVPAGDLQTTQVQQVQLSSPIQAGSYTVNATSNGFATDPTPVTTTVIGPRITSLNGTSALTTATGMQQNVSVQLDTPAPAGGLKVIFSTSTGEAQVLSSCPDGTPSCVLVPAGQFSTSFAVGGVTATAAGKPVTVTANATSNNVTWQSASMAVTVVTPVMQLFDPSNGVILTSRTVGSAVENIGARFCVSTNNCPAVLSAAQTVNFSISNDTSGGETVTPVSVVVPAGDLQTTQVQQVQLSSSIQAGSYTVNATSNGFASDPASVTTTVVQPAIVSINGTSALTVATGMQQNVSVQLDTAAPSGGLVVNLASTAGTVASVDPTVVVPQGQFSATFPVRGSSVATAQITASAPEWKSPPNLDVTVVKPVMQLFDPSNGVVLATRTIGALPENIGARFCVTTSNCSNVLSSPQTVTFSITNDSTGGGGVAVTPPTVTVPPGDLQTTQVQAVTVSSPAGTGAYTLNATDTAFATDATPVTTTVNLPSITTLNGGSALTVGTGMQQNGVSIGLDTPAPTGGLKVTFTTSSAGAQVLSSCPDATPSCMLVPAGQTFSNFIVGGVTVTAPGQPVTITAAATSNGVVWQTAKLQVTVAKPGLFLFDPQNGSVLTSRAVGSAVENIGARFCVSTNSCSGVLSSAQTVTFSISGDTTGGETVSPTTVTVPSGDQQTTQVQQVQLSSPKQAGSYTLNATDTGFATDAAPVTTAVH